MDNIPSGTFFLRHSVYDDSLYQNLLIRTWIVGAI